jgi:Holliday junction resolvasome RuvABC endonuclease subunit
LWELSHDDEADWRNRIAYMADCVAQYCVDNNVQQIYVEDVPPVIENSQTVKVLSALQGMLIACATLHDIHIDFVPVKAWKSKIGINLVSSKANNACKKRIKESFGKGANKNLTKVKGWTKAWEKKLSVDYANYTFGLDLIYKSPTSKFNQDDIADSINIAWSQIGDVKEYDLETFEEIMNRFYDLL